MININISFILLLIFTNKKVDYYIKIYVQIFTSYIPQFLLTPGCCWSPEPEEPEVGSEAGEEGKVPG